jgi:osmotically-inducible protein OsmY
MTILLLAASAAGLAAAGCASAGTDREWKRGDDLSSAVVDRLRYDPVTTRYTFGVTSDGGEVTLTGYVPDHSARLRAVAIARGTPGVESVEDRLRY